MITEFALKIFDDSSSVELEDTMGVGVSGEGGEGEEGELWDDVRSEVVEGAGDGADVIVAAALSGTAV